MRATGTQTDTVEEQKIRSSWSALQVADKQLEKRGLQFGEVLYEFREQSEVVPGGTTFSSTLDKLGIPHTTAYRWIAKYEESVGTRPPKPESDKCPSETSCKVAQSETTRAPLELEPEVPPVTPAVPTHTVSPEEKDREQLCFLVKRLDSLSKALQQVADDNAKWSKYEEYAEVLSLGKKIAGLVKLL